jgi:hypothetical protein
MKYSQGGTATVPTTTPIRGNLVEAQNAEKGTKIDTDTTDSRISYYYDKYIKPENVKTNEHGDQYALGDSVKDNDKTQRAIKNQISTMVGFKKSRDQWLPYLQLIKSQGYDAYMMPTQDKGFRLAVYDRNGKDITEPLLTAIQSGQQQTATA